MKQEDKELLLKDLCARLPYGIKLDFYSKATNQHYVSILLGIEPDGDKPIIAKVNDGAYTLGQDHIKPYLRPMSSMTDEECEEYTKTFDITSPDIDDYDVFQVRMVDWLLQHHFDVRGLIEKGLALEAPEGMYNT